MLDMISSSSSGISYAKKIHIGSRPVVFRQGVLDTLCFNMMQSKPVSTQEWISVSTASVSKDSSPSLKI